MTSNKAIQISGLDVLHFLEDEPLSLSKTIRFSELRIRLEERIFYDKNDKPLINEGVECELLKPGGQSWQKGKVKIHIEFIPEILESSELDSLREIN